MKVLGGGGGEILNVLGFLHYFHINPHSLSKLELIDSGEANPTRCRDD